MDATTVSIALRVDRARDHSRQGVVTYGASANLAEANQRIDLIQRPAFDGSQLFLIIYAK
jgi:hypothetical protein